MDKTVLDRKRNLVQSVGGEGFLERQLRAGATFTQTGLTEEIIQCPIFKAVTGIASLHMPYSVLQ